MESRGDNTAQVKPPLPAQLRASSQDLHKLQFEEPFHSSPSSAAQKAAKPSWLDSGLCSALKCVLTP